MLCKAGKLLLVDSDTIDSLLIKCYYNDTTIDIAYILWDDEIKNCYIKTIADNFQTYIISYDDFIDFIKLVDEAYYQICYSKGVE